jgi:hypothetical protein
MESNIDPDPKSAGGDDMVDLRRFDAKMRKGSGRSARMYHDVCLDCVQDDGVLVVDFFAVEADLPIVGLQNCSVIIHLPFNSAHWTHRNWTLIIYRAATFGDTVVVGF